jgi:hypothetical protein
MPAQEGFRRPHAPELDASSKRWYKLILPAF